MIRLTGGFHELNFRMLQICGLILPNIELFVLCVENFTFMVLDQISNCFESRVLKFRMLMVGEGKERRLNLHHHFTH